MAGPLIAGAGGGKLEALGALAFHAQRDQFDVEDDVGDVLAHAFDLDRGDGGALERRQEHAAQRVAEREAEAALERFGDERGLAAGVAGGADCWKLDGALTRNTFMVFVN